MHRRHVGGGVGQQGAHDRDHEVKAEVSKRERQRLAPERAQRAKHHDAQHELPEDQPEMTVAGTDSDLGQGLREPPTRAEQGKHEGEKGDLSSGHAPAPRPNLPVQGAALLQASALPHG